eukprot:SAG11_NODE_2175_length_3718_cov_3.873169_4_plen_92_part_00
MFRWELMLQHCFIYSVARSMIEALIGITTNDAYAQIPKYKHSFLFIRIEKLQIRFTTTSHEWNKKSSALVTACCRWSNAVFVFATNPRDRF